MKKIKYSAFVVFLVTIFPAVLWAAGAGNYGDPCNSDSDCDNDFTYGNCCLDSEFCGEMLNKCVWCEDDEKCNETVGIVGGDWDPPEWFLSSCISGSGVCYSNCRFINDCPDERYIACENKHCYQCYEDSDCAWRASDGVKSGVCINHICLDCRNDDDCIFDPDNKYHDPVCQRNYCETSFYFIDGDIAEETVEDGVVDGDNAESSGGDSENKNAADGDSGAELAKDDDDASCNSGGSGVPVFLLALMSLMMLRRKRL